MSRKVLAFLLRILSTAILRKYRPKIIAVTGSVGKSSAKEAIFMVLKKSFQVRRTERNRNTEIGIPATIIGTKPGDGSPTRWLGGIWKGLKLVFNKYDYPGILIVEMGTNKPGDLPYLTSFIKPQISVITNVGVSHLEFFSSRQDLINEKATLVKILPSNGLAVLNADDPVALSFKDLTDAKVITFGFSEHANYRASDFEYIGSNKNFGGIKVRLRCSRGEYLLRLKRSLGRPSIYSALAALAVADYLNVSLPSALESLEDFISTPGRLRLIEGKNGVTIIDDTYNAAPDSMIAALESLANFPGNNKIAILSRMAELGNETESGHRRVGEFLATLPVDYLFVRDNDARLIADEALARGFPKEKIYYFTDKKSLMDQLKPLLKTGHLVLVKGSRAEYMEEIVEELMLEPEKANELLVRQWLS